MRRVMCVLGVSLTVLSTDAAFGQDLVERGEAVYAAQRCQLCHAVAGKGNAKGPLDGVGGRLTPEAIREWIVNPAAMTEKTKASRKPAMRAYGALGKDDLDALVAYLQSLKK